MWQRFFSMLFVLIYMFLFIHYLHMIGFFKPSVHLSFVYLQCMIIPTSNKNPKDHPDISLKSPIQCKQLLELFCTGYQLCDLHIHPALITRRFTWQACQTPNRSSLSHSHVSILAMPKRDLVYESIILIAQSSTMIAIVCHTP
jgi:hypothetical protein